MTAKSPPEDAQNVREAAQLLNEIAGVALGAVDVYSHMSGGDAAAWMLPPVYHSIAQKTKGNIMANPTKKTPSDQVALNLRQIEEARRKLSLESAWEIEVLASMILEKIGSPEWSLEIEPHMLLRTIGLRVQALSQVVMAALDDEIQTTAFLTEKVFGDAERAPAAV